MKLFIFLTFATLVCGQTDTVAPMVPLPLTAPGTSGAKPQPRVEHLTEVDSLQIRNLLLQQQALMNEKCANARIPVNRCHVDLERGLIVEGVNPTTKETK